MFFCWGVVVIVSSKFILLPLVAVAMIQFDWLYIGLSPLPVTVANEGL